MHNTSDWLEFTFLLQIFLLNILKDHRQLLPAGYPLYKYNMIITHALHDVRSQLTNVAISNVHQHVCISTAPYCCSVLWSYEYIL